MFSFLDDFFNSLTTKKTIQIIFAIGFLAYFDSLFNGFVWEDMTFIISKIYAQNLDILKQFTSDGAFNTGGRYMPIAGVYAAISYFLFSEQPFLYHLVQLILHITNSILLFSVLKKFFGKNLSIFLSIIFLVHPLNVESVSYMASFSGPLFFFFGILALILSFEEKIDYKKIVLISVLLLLSSLTREHGLVFLFIIFAYRILFNRKQISLFLLSEFLVFLVYFPLRLSKGGLNFLHYEQVPIAALNLTGRLMNIPAEMFYYLKNFLYPTGLAVNQRWIVEQVDFRNFYFPLAIEVSILVILIFLGIYLWISVRKYFYVYIFFFLWFLTGISLYLNIIPLDMTVADRWFYFPMVGLLGLIGAAVKGIRLKNDKVKLIAISFSILIILAFSLRTLVRNANFSDSITLFTRDSQVSDNFETQNLLGIAYQHKGNYNQALIHYKKSVEYFPNPTNLYNLASLYASLGDYAKSEEYYSKIIDMGKNRSFPKIFILQVYADYTMVNYLQGKNDQALQAASEVIKIESKPSTHELYEIILNRKQLEVDRFKPI